MRRFFTLFAVLLTVGSAAFAQAQSADGPPLIAGRLSLAEGDAQIWRVEDDAEDAAGQWDTAQVNDVVTVGTGLYTGANGRTELRVGPNTFRLASGSRGGFSQLDYDNAVFNLEHGSVNARLARAEHGELTAVTVGGARVDLAAPGRYRIDAGDGDGQLRVNVFSGQASVRTDANALNVAAGQALVVGPGFASIDFERANATAFDSWALARDDRYDNVRSARYVSPYMTGYEELDVHGDWIPDATYGNVWVPRVVPVGWAPYRNGQWRWVRPWGWTWVDYAPWGYAPFHYGRWVTIDDRWCWWPGGYHRRPVWAPALVGFVGSGVSVSIGFGSGYVGWYPLAPWHRYRPHYRHGNHYTTIINQTIIHQPPRHGLSRRPPQQNPEGTTMVPGPRFRDPIIKVALPPQSRVADLQPMAPPPKSIGLRRVAHEDMARGAVPVQPSPKSTLGTNGALSNNGAPAPSADRPAPAPQMAPAPRRETRVMPPVVADPIPNRGLAPQPPLPGNNPAPLAQPPKFNRVPPTAIQTAPAPRAAPDMARPAPRARMPEELLPQSQQWQRVAPAEPARFPPGAPPTMPRIKAPVAAPAAAPPMAQRAPVPQAAPPAPPRTPVPHVPPPAPSRAPVPHAAPPVAQHAPVPQAAPPMVQRAPAPQPAARPAPQAEPRGAKQPMARGMQSMAR